jgi:prolipoprotein diacylglyceryltransferase
MNTAFILPDGSATVPLIPTQLISSVANFIIFLSLLTIYLSKKETKPYYIFFLHMLLYSGFRFTVEFFRMDPREFWGPLSISQWIFVFMLPVIVWFFCRNKVERNK